MRVANDGGDDRDPLDIGAVTGDDDIGLVAVETVASLTDVEILELEAFRQDGAKASPKDFGEAEAIEKAAQVHQSGVLVQNHTALGLSTLAIAMGFLSEAIFSDENQAILAALDDLSILDAVVPSDGAQGPDGQIATSGINAFAGEGDGGLDGKTDLSALKASDNDGQAQHKDKTMLESSFKLAVDSSLETVLFTDQAIQLDPFKLVKAAKVGAPPNGCSGGNMFLKQHSQQTPNPTHPRRYVRRVLGVRRLLQGLNPLPGSLSCENNVIDEW